MNTYQVIVSNVGTVYDGPNEEEAFALFNANLRDSRQAIGRGAGEDVTLMLNGESYHEYIGLLSSVPEPLARATRHTFAQDDKARPTLDECLDLEALRARLVSLPKGHHPSPYHTPEYAEAYSEYRTACLPATIQLVEGDGGYSLTARIGNKEYILILEAQDNTRTA